jgi:hypothetical protein
LDPKELGALFSWFDLGWRVIDEVVAERSGQCRQSTVQLWPEHLDVGTSLDGFGAGGGVNLGFSAGDAVCEEPYAYVGPWGAECPGDDGYWNAPFGALLPRADVRDAAGGVAFMRDGLDRLS